VEASPAVATARASEEEVATALAAVEAVISTEVGEATASEGPVAVTPVEEATPAEAATEAGAITTNLEILLRNPALTSRLLPVS
jgi:hypothetical protein